jgi:hypothetical protein
MSRTRHHNNGDKVEIKKNKAGSQSFPRKMWKEGLLNNKYVKKQCFLFEINKQTYQSEING